MQLNTSDSVAVSKTALSPLNAVPAAARNNHREILLQGVDVWNAWLTTQPESLAIDLNNANLKNANLTGANLNHASMVGADLSHAQLERANLNGANLQESNLKDARLEQANLRCTNLTDANLIRANLKNTNLTHAILENANLTQAQLTDADLTHTNLTLVNLQEANLERVKLQGSNLAYANLGYAYLYRANLEDSHLYRANLTRANLTQADFSRANLTRSELTHATLKYTNFSEANLNGSALNNAVFCKTILSNTNLGNTAGLEGSNHSGPSTLDHRTLEQSGSLSAEFLRGCGLPDAMINSSACLPDRHMSFNACFISHCPSDRAFAQRIHDQLQDLGIRCWLDEHCLLAGNLIHSRSDQYATGCEKVLLCVSTASVNRWWVTDKIDTAVKKEKQLKKQGQQNPFALIALDVDGCLSKENCESELAGNLALKSAADFKGWETDAGKFEQGFEFVVNTLKTDDHAGHLPVRH